MLDGYGRTIDYMRISVTDRCDLRCKYCMPKEGIQKVDKSRILGYEEILRICSAAIELGIDKFKITGGEPLVRYDLMELLRGMRKLQGCKEITMTTNGQLLAPHLEELTEIGIDGINISLDTLKPERYKEMTRLGDLQKTLEAVELSIEHGIKTKLNCIVQRDFNEDDVIELVDFALSKGIDIRFIELMPIGIADAEKGISNRETMRRIKEVYPEMKADESRHGNGPARYYRISGKRGSIGFISAINDSFCESCNRIRLTSMGYIKPCLCYEDGVFIRPYLEKGDKELKQALEEIIRFKPAAHCFENIKEVDHHAMAEIGG
ncbi:MAG: GTP 3',8-cyclase MoaA [Mogibacterium sp.]|nr:GTP 3',8-cyclase MoaA [Mogibacterium sp.]